MRKIIFENSLLLIDTKSFSFNMQEIENRRFMYSPLSGELIIGRQYKRNQLIASHAEEHGQAAAKAPFDSFVRGWVGTGNSYKDGVIHFAPPIDTRNIDHFNRGFSTLEMFAANGANSRTLIRGFGDRWEQPLSDLIQKKGEKIMPYSAYDYDRLEAAHTMKIDRTVYFETAAEDIAPLAALPLTQLERQREESAAAEQAIYDDLKKQAALWEQQAGNTALLDRAIAYMRTPAVEHTSNEWKQTDYEWHNRSNMVYQMSYHVYENTRYDRERQESVPYSWSLTWNIRTNDPDGRGSAKIAGQDRKTFADKAAMEKYLAGRMKAYDHLFTEISPPIPKEYAEHFKVNGLLLPGYTIEGEEIGNEKIPEKENDLPASTPVRSVAAETSQPVIPIVLSAGDPQGRMKEITDRLEKGITELFESERYMEYLRVMSKFHNYSINNSLLIAFQKPDASLIAGFTAWQKQFERNVKKGEKGIKIIAPAPFKIKQEKEKLDPQSNKPVIGKDGKSVMEEQEITIPAYKVVSVFDVSQTEGKELPDISVDSLTGDVEHFKDVFAALEKASPVPIRFENIEGGAHGYYSLKDKRIAIQEGMSQLQTLKTAIHEIAHAKLHDIDLNSPKEEKEKRPDQRTREVQAESVAYTVCQHYGLDTSDYSFGYVAGWSSGREMAELKSSLETIRSAAAEIINSVDEKIAELQKDQNKGQEQTKKTPIPEKDSFTIYQLKHEDVANDYRFEPYDRLQAAGLSVDSAHYASVYTAELTPGMTLEDIYTRFNIDHPKDFKGHSLSVSDVVVLHQNGKDTAHYVDSIGYKQVPEFFKEVQKQLVPDDSLTGEKVTTPRGTFSLTALSRKQMEAAGYGIHHRSDDGKYLIMGNGTRAFAVTAEPPQNYLKHVEDIVEQNDNNFDGIINNTPQTPSVGELEQKAKAGEAISLIDLAKAIKAEEHSAERPEKKASIREQLKEAREQSAHKKQTAKSKSYELEV